MKQITFYLDFISPYAYLAFEALSQTLMGTSYSVTYKPILFAALLKHHGQLGPAEIPAKREWTYRQVQWLALRQNTPLQMPGAHPFNPLGLLRLALACAPANRYICEAIFKHVWTGGADAADPDRLLALSNRLAPPLDANSEQVKDLLKANTDEAIQNAVFGVPTLRVDGKNFWGLDALPMLRDYVQGADSFDSAAWANAALLPIGSARKLGAG